TAAQDASHVEVRGFPLPAANPRLYGGCVPELGGKGLTAYGPEGETGCRDCSVAAEHQAICQWTYRLPGEVGFGHWGYRPYREVWREVPTPGYPQGCAEDRRAGRRDRCAATARVNPGQSVRRGVRGAGQRDRKRSRWIGSSSCRTVSTGSAEDDRSLHAG